MDDKYICPHCKKSVYREPATVIQDMHLCRDFTGHGHTSYTEYQTDQTNHRVVIHNGTDLEFLMCGDVRLERVDEQAHGETV